MISIKENRGGGGGGGRGGERKGVGLNVNNSLFLILFLNSKELINFFVSCIRN